MSSNAEATGARAPKRARGKQRVADLLQAAAAVFAEKGYEAATMTEIALRAGASIGSLYQFFPVKEALADTLVQNYVALLAADLQQLESRCVSPGSTSETLVEERIRLAARAPARARPRRCRSPSHGWMRGHGAPLTATCCTGKSPRFCAHERPHYPSRQHASSRWSCCN